MHKVIYRNSASAWNEALPLGNGHFGGMVFFEENQLTIAMNHYEVYYRKLHRYSKKYKNSSPKDHTLQSGFSFEEMKKRATEGQRDPALEPFLSYRESLGFSYDETLYGKPAEGSSHFPTGEIRLNPVEKLSNAEHYLELDVEKASIHLRLKNEKEQLDARTIVTCDRDCVITEITQTNADLLDSVILTIPKRKYLSMQAKYHEYDKTTFYYVGSCYPDGEDKERYEPFKFIVMLRLIGAEGTAKVTEDELKIHLHDAQRNFQLITTVVTEEETEELLSTAISRVNEATLCRLALVKLHQEYWKNFWNRSSIILPDKLLEDLWYVNLYAIACSSGKGGRMYEQACGLNGLWDIKQPTMWGSMWYWDVNIQAAFWPLYTANHLEVAKAFNDGLLSYTSSAERMAKQFYGLEGYAGDYPHALYLCIWPWCAQFLWNYYQHSLDMEFLEKRAYPVFKQILRFFEGYLQFDKDNGFYFAFPDISPEQGPLTRNSTITLSTLKYLLQFSIEANVLLKADTADRDKWILILENLAPYPVGLSDTYGEFFKDSEWAPTDLQLRHPSLLMPIYPVGEINKKSEERLLKRAENTLRYAEEHSEYGVFQFGWLSCAASRLGKGNTALRLLYEHGIDLSLRCNGLFSEETERWINYCNIGNEPLYYPHVMEASGELVASINEMLLQSYDGVIDVFPAVPDGKIENERVAGIRREVAARKAKTYDAWLNCEFKDFLAVGAFNVSAVRKNGITVRVEIKSLAGKTVMLRNPFPSGESVTVTRVTDNIFETIEYEMKEGNVVFATEPSAQYVIISNNEEQVAAFAKNKRNENMDYPRVHRAHTQRRVFLGKDHNTDYYRLLDHFTFDYYTGNARESRNAVYRLDFGVPVENLEKDYTHALPKQFHVEGIMGQQFRKITANVKFDFYNGLGWETTEGLVAFDHGEPDELRRDFIGGYSQNAFRIELPKGKYELLFVSGDSTTASYTEIEIEGQKVWESGKVQGAGEFACEIVSISRKKDGYANILFRGGRGLPWRINLMIINKSYPYL